LGTLPKSLETFSYILAEYQSSRVPFFSGIFGEWGRLKIFLIHSRPRPGKWLVLGLNLWGVGPKFWKWERGFGKLGVSPKFPKGGPNLGVFEPRIYWGGRLPKALSQKTAHPKI